MDWNDEVPEQVATDDVHTPDHPYCDDLSCWCHTSVAYHDGVEHPTYGEDDLEQAYDFFDLPRR